MKQMFYSHLKIFLKLLTLGNFKRIQKLRECYKESSVTHYPASTISNSCQSYLSYTPPLDYLEANPSYHILQLKTQRN